MAKSESSCGGDNATISRTGELIGKIALAVILLLLGWTGKTVYEGAVQLAVLSDKVHVFQTNANAKHLLTDQRIEKLGDRVHELDNKKLDRPRGYAPRQNKKTEIIHVASFTEREGSKFDDCAQGSRVGPRTPYFGSQELKRDL